MQEKKKKKLCPKNHIFEALIYKARIAYCFVTMCPHYIYQSKDFVDRNHIHVIISCYNILNKYVNCKEWLGISLKQISGKTGQPNFSSDSVFTENCALPGQNLFCYITKV